jgi:cupin superfamily acireductone dioxygenase involved in methionine salvage
MELVIIALIAVEVIIVCFTIYHWFDVTADNSNQALIRDGPELWQMLVGSQESKQNQDKLVHSS